MAELDPYSREDSTRLPIGEPKRNGEVVSNYKSEGFSNEAEGVVFAMLMQYAKTDSENAENRARQFAKILYEYSIKLINDLPVGNSVIAKKIAKAIDNKVSSEMNDLAKGIDFSNEIYGIKDNVRDYLSSLISLANGDLITSEQLGLTQKSGKKQQSAIEQKIDSEISESFIELIQKENTIAPDTRKMPVNPRALTIPVQTLAKNAATLFNASVTTFTSGLTTKTIERLNNIQKAVSSFGQAGASIINGDAEKRKITSSSNEINDSHNTIKQAIKVKRGTIAAHIALMQAEMLTMEEEQNKEERNLRGWVMTVDSAKKQFDDAKKVVGTMITSTIHLAASAFGALSKTIKSTYKKVKNGGFLNFLFSPSGILTFGLLGWAGYKLIFSGIGEKIKNHITNVIYNAIAVAVPFLSGLLDGEIKGEKDNNNNSDEYGLAELFPTPAASTAGSSQQKSEENFFVKLFQFSADEAEFYGSLSIRENGAGKTADQVTDHWLENVKKFDALIGKMTKNTWGMTPQEWLLNLGKDNTAKIGVGQKSGNGWIDNIKTGMRSFWSYIKKAATGTAEWFKNTTFGKSVISTWDVIAETCRSIYKAYKPIIKIALKLSPLMLAIGTILAPPIGTILSMVGKFGRLVISLMQLSFMRPIMGIVGNAIKSNPMTGLLVAGVAIGLGALSMGIWNAFHKKPMDNGGILPLEQYSISMGLARGQIDENSIESRLGSWKHTIATYDPNNKKSVESMNRIKGVDVESIKLIENGITQFEENYRFTMDNQDEENTGTLHWYILNRDEHSRISNSIWARRLAELPILGIGPELVNKSLYTGFINQLDTRFSKRDDNTWYSIRNMLMRMKEVDRVFRVLADSATPQEIDNFAKSVGTDTESVKAIYDWTHSGEDGFKLQDRMMKLFGKGLEERIKKMPNIAIEFKRVGALKRNDDWFSRYYEATIYVNGMPHKMQFPNVTTKGMEDKYVFDTLFSGIANDRASEGGTSADKKIVISKISPWQAARAFANYMKRSRSGFYTLPPWNFSRDDVDKLKLGDTDGERVYKMKDLVSEIDQYKMKTMGKIQEAGAMDAIERRYNDLPNFDGQNDSKTLVGMVYVLGTILQLCDEIK